MLRKLGVKLQVQKDTLLIQGSVVWRFQQKNISEFNERITEEMKKKLVPLIEEYDKKH